jgi:hypothetical protein
LIHACRKTPAAEAVLPSAVVVENTEHWVEKKSPISNHSTSARPPLAGTVITWRGTVVPRVTPETAESKNWRNATAADEFTAMIFLM